MAPSVFEVRAKGTAKFTSRCRTKISPGSNLMQGNKLSQWIVLNIFRRVRRKLHCLCCIVDLFAFNRVLGTIRARVEVGNDRVDIFYRVANPNIWMYYLPDPSTNRVLFCIDVKKLAMASVPGLLGADIGSTAAVSLV